MAEMNEVQTTRRRKVRHSGRGSQVMIYLGKQMRFFINESDWKVLPMAAIIAALVGMVIRERLFINMEGSLIGAFSLTCMCIWNGCFNSIQAVCRERAIIKREHRSGMHVTSYMTAHMIYQLFLCAAQTGLSIYVLMFMGVPFPEKGFMTPWMMVDIAITMLLVSYASDMLSLFISSISHTTTGAMTVMPFVLIFQLVFSGGIIPLPAWSQVISNYTISNYGIHAIAAQSGYNELPMVTGWKTLDGMRDNELGGTITLGQILDLLDSPAVQKRQDMEVIKSYTVGEAAELIRSVGEDLHLGETVLASPVTARQVLELLQTDASFEQLRTREIFPAEEGTTPLTLSYLLNEILSSADLAPLLDKEFGQTVTLSQVLDFLRVGEIVSREADQVLNQPVTLGELTAFLKNNPVLQNRRDRSFTFKTTIGDLFELFGEENVKTIVEQKTAAAARKPEYERTERNIVNNWLMLGLFIVVFSLMSILALELIDKDKR